MSRRVPGVSGEAPTLRERQQQRESVICVRLRRDNYDATEEWIRSTATQYREAEDALDGITDDQIAEADAYTARYRREGRIAP